MARGGKMKKGYAKGGKMAMKKKGMAKGGKIKKMANGGKVKAMKKKGMARGGKMKKGYAAGGKMPGMTLANIRAAAKAKGYKLMKG